MASHHHLSIRILLLALALISIAATRPTAREMFEDFDTIVYLQPAQSGNYWAIPNGDSVQYYGASCDPENTACILAGSDDDGATYARLQLGHDPTPGGYNNADLAGVPTGTTSGSGEQLWCPTPGQALTMAFRARWSDGYSQSGADDVAVGSNGFGVWSNPVQPDMSLAPTTAVFFQWVDEFGLSTLITQAVDGQTEILSFKPVPIAVDMQSWTGFTIEIKRLGNGSDQIRFYVRSFAGPFIPVSTVVVPDGVGCLSLEIWNDIRAYDALGMIQLQNLPVGETQHMDLDWYHFSQS